MNGFENEPRYYEDLSGHEIAAVLGVSRGTAVRPAEGETIAAGARRVRRRRRVSTAAGAVVVVAAALGGGLALAGSGGPASLPPAASTTTPPPATSTEAVTTTTPPRSTTRSPASPAATKEATKRAAEQATPSALAAAYSLDVIGTRSYGPLRFGMTEDESLATGTLGEIEVQGSLCTRYTGTFGGSVVVSKRYGVVAIRVTRPVATSRGVHVGSTVADVKAAYPNVTEFRNGLYVRTEPGILGFDVAGEHLHHTQWPDTGVLYRIEIGARHSDCAFAF